MVGRGLSAGAGTVQTETSRSRLDAALVHLLEMTENEGGVEWGGVLQRWRDMSGQVQSS